MEKNTIPENLYNILRKQHYQVDNHSGVKLCGWVRKSLLENKECYKSKFYGITTHRCIQCSPSLVWCQLNCIFCWRVLPSDIGDSLYKEPQWEEPEIVANKIIDMHKTVIMGYKGIIDRIGDKKFSELLEPKHVAISLSGEPTLYPYLDELIDVFHKKGMSTFVVSNGILTEVIEKINPTQLYISLDAYDYESFKKICKGSKTDWECILNTLEIIGEKKRSCIRTTLIRNYNDSIEKYVSLYEKSNVDFIELKSYMNVGYSRRRLSLDNMLTYNEILDLSGRLESCSEMFSLLDGSYDSRVSLLTNKFKNTNPKLW